MSLWVEFGVWRRRREELIREVQDRALAREARKVREAFAAVRERPVGIEVRWGLAEDEEAIADLLQLNGMPRWVAFEERFVVAERGGRIVGALRYATESKRLSLGLLVVDPWAGERRTGRALYSGAVELAGELGVAEVLAAPVRGAGCPGEVGYSRAGRGWRLDVASGPRRTGARGRWRTALRDWAERVLPSRRALR